MEYDIVYIKDVGNSYMLKFLNGRYKNMYVYLSSSSRAQEKCREIYERIFFIKIFNHYIGFCRGKN